MGNVISGTEGGSFAPLNNNLPTKIAQPISDSAATRVVLSKKEVEPLNLWTHPNTFSGTRDTLYLLDTLKTFVDWQRSKLDDIQIKKFRDAVTPDSVVSETMDDLIPQFDKAGVNLIEVIKNRLIKSNDFEEKIIYLKVLFSTSNQELFINDVLVPVFEGRFGLGNFECNQGFCNYFLDSLNKESVEKIIKQIDYKNINNMDVFAESISRLTCNELALNYLFELNETLVSDLSDSPERYRDTEALQDTITACLNRVFTTEEFPVPVKHLATLYKKAVDLEIMDRAGYLLAGYYPNEAPKIFKETFMDQPDNTESGRMKRFNAIEHYATFTQENGAKSLGEFIQKETDALLVSNACCLIVECCGIDGKRVLINTIVKQIRQQLPSIPLASTIKLIPYNDQYRKILNHLLSRDYKTDEGFKKALSSLEDTETCSIAQNSSGSLVFYLNENGQNDLVIELIKGIGFENLIHAASNSRIDMSKEEQSTKDNSLEIIEYAWNKKRSQMADLFLQAVPYSKYNDLDSVIKQMVGMSSVGIVMK